MRGQESPVKGDEGGNGVRSVDADRKGDGKGDREGVGSGERDRDTSAVGAGGCVGDEEGVSGSSVAMREGERGAGSNREMEERERGGGAEGSGGDKMREERDRDWNEVGEEFVGLDGGTKIPLCRLWALLEEMGLPGRSVIWPQVGRAAVTRVTVATSKDALTVLRGKNRSERALTIHLHVSRWSSAYSSPESTPFRHPLSPHPHSPAPLPTSLCHTLSPHPTASSPPSRFALSSSPRFSPSSPKWTTSPAASSSSASISWWARLARRGSSKPTRARRWSSTRPSTGPSSPSWSTTCWRCFSHAPLTAAHWGRPSSGDWGSEAVPTCGRLGYLRERR